MCLVGKHPDLDRLPELARASVPDVVFVGYPDSVLPRPCCELLEEHPLVKVIGLSLESGCAHLHELRLSHVQFCDVSPADVIETIRAVARRPVD